MTRAEACPNKHALGSCLLATTEANANNKRQRQLARGQSCTAKRGPAHCMPQLIMYCLYCLYCRCLKRLRDEESSRFTGQPTLHQRYVLLQLLGRGGFSEVHKAFDLADLKFVAVKVSSSGSCWCVAGKSCGALCWQVSKTFWNAKQVLVPLCCFAGASALLLAGAAAPVEQWVE